MNSDQFLDMIVRCQQEGKDIDTLHSDYVALLSAGKTPLGLNQWVKSDKPLMEDFNEDNRIIDEKLRKLQDKPERLPLPLTGGLQPYPETECSYMKDAQGIVHIHFVVVPQASHKIGPTVLVATLPVGFRPLSCVVGCCAGYYYNSFFNGFLHVYPYGNVTVQFGTDLIASAAGHLTFLAEQ